MSDVPANANKIEIDDDAENAGGVVIKKAELAVNTTSYDIPSTINGKNVTTIGENAFERGVISSVVIPDSVINIKESAFDECLLLENVTIGKNVKTIGDGAFRYSGLTSVIIPDSVESIGICAFEDCIELAVLDLGSGVKSIGNSAFKNCPKLSALTIPDSVTTIGNNAFEGCANIADLKFGKNITTIGEGAFCKNDRITSLTIPKSISSIEKKTFSCWSKLEELNIGENVKYIGDGAFSVNSSLKTVTVPGSVERMGLAIFAGCEELETVTFKENIKIIPESMFEDCTNLKDVYIPETVTEIGMYAFYGCTSLECLFIPDSVIGVDSGYHAFKDCSSLKYIVFGKSFVTPLSELFVKCNALETLYCYNDNVNYYPTNSAVAKVTENKDGTVTLEFTYIPDEDTSVIIHDIHRTIRNVILPSGKENITIEHTSHNEDLGTVTAFPTEETEGKKEFKCTICGKVIRTEVLPKLESAKKPYESGVVPEPNSFTVPSVNARVEIKDGKAVISWDKINKADSYVVYIKRNGRYVKHTETEKTSVTVKNLKNGQSYCFKIRYKVNGRLANSSQEILVVMGNGKKPAVTASAYENSVKLTWSEVDGAEAYAVYKVSDGKAKKLIETQKTGVKVSGLDPQTEYSFIVRVKIDGKWSTMKRSDIVTVLTK